MGYLEELINNTKIYIKNRIEMIDLNESRILELKEDILNYKEEIIEMEATLKILELSNDK